MKWAELGYKDDKEEDSSLSNLSSLTISNQPQFFGSWLTAYQRGLRTGTSSLCPQCIYRLNLLYYFLDTCPKSTFCPALCLYLSASCYCCSISSAYTFNSLWDYLKSIKNINSQFSLNILKIWLLLSILKLDSYKKALKRSNSVNIQFLTTLYLAVLIFFLCSLCQAMLTNEFADIIYGTVNLMCNNIKFILMSRNPSLICMFSQNKNKYLRLLIQNS